MVLIRSRTDPPRPKRLAATLYAYEFCNNAILLYPLYALLFTDTGLSTAAVSSVLALWAASALVLEIPSGVWADLVSRRALLVVAPAFSGAGFALWTFAPSYWSFALGAVLWGVQGALKSGAMEALVYTELERAGAADRYAAVIGRARTVEVAAVPLAMLAAAPVFSYGGYRLVGAASVAACVAAALVAMTFPDRHATERSTGDAGRLGVFEAAAHSEPAEPSSAHATGHRPAEPVAAVADTAAPPQVQAETTAPPQAGVDTTAPPREHAETVSQPQAGVDAASAPHEAAGPGYLATLRAGIAEVRTNRPVLLSVLAFPGVMAIWGTLDEYVPLLARETGVAAVAVPLLVLLVWAGVTAGGLLAGRCENLGGRGMAAVLTGAAVVLAAGALVRVPTGIGLVAVAFGLFQIATILVEARLQHQIEGPSRATVTSVANLALGVGTIAMYGLYAALATSFSHSAVFALTMLPYLGVAVAYLRSRSNAQFSRPARP